LRGLLKTMPVTINTGSLTGPDTIKSTDDVSFSFSSSTLSTDTVSAVIPNQTLTSFSDSIITLDPTAVLQKATFSSGQFGLSINNQTGLTVGAQMEFYNFVSTKPTRDTLIIDQLVAPHTPFQLNVNLDTIQIVNGDPSSSGTTMRFTVKIKTVSSGGTIPASTITSSDFVNAAFTPLQPFAVKSLTGIMNPMTLAVNTGASGLNLGDATTRLAISSVTFDSVRMALNLGLSSGFPIAYNLNIIAMNRKVVPYKIDSITVPQPVGSTTIQPGLNNFAQIVLNNSSGLSTFLGKFFPNFPDTFIVRGTATINPNPPTTGVVYDTTKVYSAISTYFPLKLGILNGQYTDVASISGSFDSTFVTDVKSGSISFSITNALPLALNFRAAFMGMDALSHTRDTLLSLPSGGNVYTVAGAQVNGAGTVSAPTQSTFKIGLVTPEILALAASDSVYIKLTLNTSGSAGPPVQAVRINAADYITIRASANMVYTVNKKH
jgi:hypothetical protein